MGLVLYRKSTPPVGSAHYHPVSRAWLQIGCSGTVTAGGPAQLSAASGRLLACCLRRGHSRPGEWQLLRLPLDIRNPVCAPIFPSKPAALGLS